MASPLQPACPTMKLVVFGLAISSSWGNGHATLWRGLVGALAGRGHEVVFFERDLPYYASHRDLRVLAEGRLHIYPAWDDVAPLGTRELAGADVGIVTSFCPDALAAERLLLESDVGLRVFYDLDTAVTLDRLARGEPVAYLGPRGLSDYDLVLSYTGGASLDRLRLDLGARRTAPLYGSVDPAVHQPVPADDLFRSDLSYLGTYAADRQDGVDRLFLAPARQRPARRFMLAGSQYPTDFPWHPNIFYLQHLTPSQHPAFYCSSRLTLNVTRAAMAAIGYCPSGRLFEAAACGVPILTDRWAGLEHFFMPGDEVLVAASTEDAVAALERDEGELRGMAKRARERTLDEHTATRRAAELEAIFEGSDSDVGNHSSGRRRDPDPAAGVF